MSDNSYASILKSTSLVGGAQVIKIIFNIARSKVLAVLIGPSGIGLISAFNSTIELIQKIIGLGIGFSAVREIAHADATKNEYQISESIKTTLYISIILGIIGTIMAFLLRKPLSRFTFGNDQYALQIGILSIIIFLNIVSGSQAALIQGKRRIKDLAKLAVFGAIYGTIFSIPLVYFWGENGIVPFIIVVALAQLLTTWWYSYKISVEKIQISIKKVISKSKNMISLGFSFMAGGFATVLGTYIIRVILIRKLEIEAVGFYQAAVALSALYIGIILDAMGKDFYPRLTAVSNDSKKCERLINEQTEVGILLAAPGLILTLALAPFLINIFYSSEFAISYQILRWMILGIFLRVISWPMGFIFIAKGKSMTFFLIQFIFNVAHVILILLLVDHVGIIGTGVGFSIVYFLHVVFMKLLITREIQFQWTPRIIKLILIVGIVFSCSFLLLLITSEILGGIIVCLIGLGLGYFTLRRLMLIMEIQSFTQIIQLFMKRIKKVK
ncbi:O-antigen translocase [Bacteroidota bacterium]